MYCRGTSKSFGQKMLLPWLFSNIIKLKTLSFVLYLKKRGGEAYMISVPEQSAIKILDIKQVDMSGEWSKYTQHIISGSILSS